MIHVGLVSSVLVKLLGQSLLAVVSLLLSGKTFRSLLILPFAKLAKWTKNTTDDRVVDEARQDLGLDVSDISEDKKK